MKLTIIQPAIGKKSDDEYVRTWQMEPIAPALIAALTPKDTEIRFFDDRVEKIDFDEKTDLVSMPVETFTAKRAYQISAEFRKRNIPVVLGGIHPTMLPEEAADYCDSVVVGEAESIWKNVIEDFKKGRLQKFYHGGKSMFEGVIPDRSIFRGKYYLPIALVETGRGCVFSCDFCSIYAIHNKTHRRRNVNDIVAELKGLKQKTVFLVDDNITANAVAAKELFRAIRPLKIKWVSQATINIAYDDELMREMRDSGCIALLIGFESLNKENLKLMNKSWNIGIETYRKNLRKIREYGFCLYAAFIFGYDYDNEKIFNETLEFTIQEKFFIAAFNYIMPFPNTPLYKRFEKEGRLRYNKWWLDRNYYFGDVAFIPKSMSSEKLQDMVHAIRKKFYRISAIIRRGMEFKANSKDIYRIGLFYYLNLALRKEIYQKKGIPMGDDNIDVENFKLLSPELKSNNHTIS